MRMVTMEIVVLRGHVLHTVREKVLYAGGAVAPSSQIDSDNNDSSSGGAVTPSSQRAGNNNGRSIDGGGARPSSAYYKATSPVFWRWCSGSCCSVLCS